MRPQRFRAAERAVHSRMSTSRGLVIQMLASCHKDQNYFIATFGIICVNTLLTSRGYNLEVAEINGLLQEMSIDGSAHKPKLFKILQEISELLKASQDQ